MWTDSSAAMGISSRQGLGKLRHIDTQALWIQEKVRTRQIILKKVRGDINPADLLTKFISSKDKVDQLVELYGLAFMAGRAKSAPQLKRKVNAPNDVAEDDFAVFVLSDIDDGRDVVVPEAAVHDAGTWPHLYPSDLREAMFPTAVAAPEVETIDAEALDELGKLHRRWAAHRISVTRG